MKEKYAEAEQQNQHPSEVVATPISAEANLPDPKETPKKKKMKKKKSNLNGEQQELNKKEDEEGEVPNETNAQGFPPEPSLVIEVPADLEMKTKSLSHGQSQSSHAEAEGQNQHPSQVCPQPLVVPISVEANLPNPKDTPKKKRKQKKKDKSYLNGEQELNKKDDEKGEVPNETNAQVFSPEPSLATVVPTDLEMKIESLSRGQSQSSHAVEGQNQHPSQVCPQPLVVPISVEVNLPEPKDTPKKKTKQKKKKKDKSYLNGEQEELNKKEDENGEVPNETNAQLFLPEPSLVIEVPANLEMKTESLSHGQSQSCLAKAEGQNQHPFQVCPQPLVVPISVEANLPDPKDTLKKKRMQKRKKKDKSYLNGEQQELNKKEDGKGEIPNETNTQVFSPEPSLVIEVPTDLEVKTESLSHGQSQSSLAEAEGQNQHPSQVFPQPLVVPISVEANLPDPKDTPKKKRKQKKKKYKSYLNGEQEVPNETNAQVFSPEPSLATEVPTDLKMKTESLSHGQSQSSHAEAEGQNQHPSQVCPQPLVVPISIEANLPDPKDTPKKKRKQKKKKKDKSYLNGEQQELNKVEVPNDTNPPKPSLAFEVPTDLEMKTDALNHDQSQTKPHTPILVSPIPQTSTLQPAIPTDTEQKMSKSKRKNMRKKMRIILNVVQPNKHNIETLVQSRMSICHTPTPTINHTMDPHPAIPTCPKQCSPIEQTISVVDPLLKIYPEPAPLIGQTIPIDPSISMDTEHKLTRSKRKRMNQKMKRMLDGAQPNGNNIKQAEILVQSGTSICHTIPYKPTDGHNQSSKLCWACRQSDHEISQCQMLKSLSRDEEICFCGEIGHSLGRCSVSLAGGGRFAKCLLCHAYGHFSYNCPGDGHRSYLKTKDDPSGCSYMKGTSDPWPPQTRRQTQCVETQHGETECADCVKKGMEIVELRKNIKEMKKDGESTKNLLKIALYSIFLLVVACVMLIVKAGKSV